MRVFGTIGVGQPGNGTWRRFHTAAGALFLLVALTGVTATADAAPESRGEAERVLARVEAKVPGELASYFNTILYVSKASSGPWAQRMFVFQRDAYGEFIPVDQFAVSTGREKQERYFTATPTGIFKLDPGRMFRMHRSKTWDNAPMPYAMFLDVTYRERATGIALHAAPGKGGHAALGRRASGGCVRMPAGKVKQLFEEIQQGMHGGMVPEFAWDEARGRTSTDGVMERDVWGAPVLKPGVGVLLVIENFSGRETLANARPGAPA